MKTLLLPHPVLLPNGSDYKDGCKFDMTNDEPKHTLDGNILVSVHFVLESVFMNSLIKKKQAEFFMVVKCAKTYKREVYRTNNTEISLRLPLAEYADKITITPYIASTTYIKSFTSSEHHQEFHDIPINLPVGVILAYGSDLELTIDSLQTLSAAICLVDNNNLKEGEYEIDVNDDHINIKMHKKTRHQVEHLRKRNMNILFPSIYMSALTHALQTLDDNTHRKWAEALTKTLKAHNIKTDELKENAYKYAQQLLKNPLNRILDIKEQDD